MFRFGFMLAILACFLLGQAGKLATNIVPGIGGAALAIIIGMIFGNLLSLKIDFMKTGMRFCERTVLASAIAMMGLSLIFSIFKDLRGDLGC